MHILGVKLLAGASFGCLKQVGMSFWLHTKGGCFQNTISAVVGRRCYAVPNAIVMLQPDLCESQGWEPVR